MQSLTISWSETGPKLVTKMSVFTSVTRSDEARNWDSECLSTALIRSHHHKLTPKWEIYRLWLAISKIGPLCSPDNLLLTHEISQWISFSGKTEPKCATLGDRFYGDVRWCLMNSLRMDTLSWVIPSHFIL